MTTGTTPPLTRNTRTSLTRSDSGEPRPRRAYRRTKPLSPEHRARLIENLRKAWRAPRRPRGPLNRAQLASARANLVRARAALAGRGLPHSEMQRAASRTNIRKAQAAVAARGLATTPARRAASLANLAKANARLRELGYPRSERQKATARRNLSKSRPLGRLPENYARYHRHKLRHGLQVRTLEQTLRLLDEDPREFEAHAESFRRAFAPSGAAEEKLVRRIAAATWRHLRLFKAQARWQSERLRRLFDRAEFTPQLGAVATHSRALLLMTLLLDRERFYWHDARLTAGLERGLNVLLRLRSGGNPGLRLGSRRSEREWRELQKLEREIEAEMREMEFRERVVQGGPEVECAIERVKAGRKLTPA